MDTTPIANPLTDADTLEIEDRALVERAQGGDRAALEQVIARHQGWIYNVALRMVYYPADAEDVTQEILIKILTKLSSFEGKSSFRTWLYRIALNHVLNMGRRRSEQNELTFTDYARGLDDTPDLDLPDPESAETRVLVDEARIGCTSGMLLCLDREQRLIYVLGAIFGVSDTVGAELLELSRDNFRQKLARARRDLHTFLKGQCGLVNRSNSCRCAKKTRGFIAAGYLDPSKLLFAGARVTAVREVAAERSDDIDALDAAYADIYRAHPFQRSPDFVAALRALLEHADFKQTLDLE